MNNHHIFFFFFFNDTATTEIYTLSLHDALPILFAVEVKLTVPSPPIEPPLQVTATGDVNELDRKSTRLNSSHSQISYAVFCLKKKKKIILRHIAERDLVCALHSIQAATTLHSLD